MNTKKNSKLKNSANSLYDIYVTPMQLHDYNKKIKLSEGVYDIASYENCFWLIDLILEEGPTLDTRLLTFELERVKDDHFSLTCSFENGKLLYRQGNLNVNFYFDYLKILKKGKILCLPIEENLY